MLFLIASLLSGGYQETLYPDWKQTFLVEEMIYEEKSEFWDLAIFENSKFGRVFAIDGIIQTTEKDEFIYHEMMAHVPLLAHDNPKSVLIIGGGDGGLLREVLKHEQLQTIVQVEIDPTIIEISKKYLPTLSSGAFENPRAKIVIQDAAQYVKETPLKFDVIICDSNDPEGPAKVLFSSGFYKDCKNLLNPDGIFVNQNGVPFMQKDELQLTRKNRQPHFKHVAFYTAPIPTYVGGFMAFGWASDKDYKLTEEMLKLRLKEMATKMKYYTPAIHLGSFALPQYMLDIF
ncbi:MAG: polyamine aminopropyltransferase [Chlamydiae bacterium CG10_big_fil_rev_8_21_14_0_10_42_34]|nr:MAG: polyamine aminopropyltransferase [Chlamydiae bacterium CG10_big_fil_rev_8_21_14_0_10_42_34]